jgi:hypothetical protein
VKLVSIFAMKFVAIRDLANVPSIGITVDPKSPGFKHPKHIHKGYRFTFGSTDIFDDLPQSEKLTVSQLLVSKGVVIDDGSAASNAAIAKVEAEIAEDKEREKRDKRARREPWTRAHKLQTAALVVSIIVGCFGFAGWYHAAHQSPIYQQQIVLKHETESLAKYLARTAIGFDTNQEARADFQVHDLKWLHGVTDDLTKQGLSVDKAVEIYNESQRTGTGVTSETLKKLSDELNRLATQLPTPQ